MSAAPYPKGYEHSPALLFLPKHLRKALGIRQLALVDDYRRHSSSVADSRKTFDHFRNRRSLLQRNVEHANFVFAKGDERSPKEMLNDCHSPERRFPICVMPLTAFTGRPDGGFQVDSVINGNPSLIIDSGS
jgi:hypothetical protein